MNYNFASSVDFLRTVQIKANTKCVQQSFLYDAFRLILRLNKCSFRSMEGGTFNMYSFIKAQGLFVLWNIVLASNLFRYHFTTLLLKRVIRYLPNSYVAVKVISPLRITGFAGVLYCTTCVV